MAVGFPLQSGSSTETGGTYTGDHDFSGADSLTLITAAAPTVNADGEVALDTTVAGFDYGLLRYYGGEEVFVVAIPVADLASPTDTHVVKYNAASQKFTLSADAGAGGGISEIVSDTTPQLGGMLDVNSNSIGDGSNSLLSFTEDASAVNNIDLGNAATGNDPTLSAVGSDANVGINFVPKGSGSIQVGGNRILTTADEGDGNGLDADTLDGNDASAFAAASHSHSSTDISDSTATGRSLIAAASAAAARTTLDAAALSVEDQVVAGGATVTVKALTTPGAASTLTLSCGDRPLQSVTNNAAFTLAAPTDGDGQIVLQITNGASAGAITFSGFTVGSDTGDSLDTTNTNVFRVHVTRIGGVSSYWIEALQ